MNFLAERNWTALFYALRRAGAKWRTGGNVHLAPGLWGRTRGGVLAVSNGGNIGTIESAVPGGGAKERHLAGVSPAADRVRVNAKLPGGLSNCVDATSCFVGIRTLHVAIVGIDRLTMSNDSRDAQHSN